MEIDMIKWTFTTVHMALLRTHHRSISSQVDIYFIIYGIFSMTQQEYCKIKQIMWLLKFASQSACVPVGAAGCPAQSPPTVDFSLVSHRSLLLMARRRSHGSPLTWVEGIIYSEFLTLLTDGKMNVYVSFVKISCTRLKTDIWNLSDIIKGC